MLIAQRYTDKEIADALFISPRTVARHVTGIFTKLDVHSRREAAAKVTGSQPV
jgi:DNA-binding CsgD family transcriptional regulator